MLPREEGKPEPEPPRRPTTDDLAEDFRRRMRARRKRAPLWLRVTHALADLFTSLLLPIVTSLGAWVSGESTALAACLTAASAVVAGVRLWLTKSPIFRDHGLETVAGGDE